MLGNSSLPENPITAVENQENAEAVVEDEEGDRNFPGSRWPTQETLALVKIRSEIDVAFRDSALKTPLWEEVSRKLNELGYNRSAKKCKEKFENIYKYHKRIKEGRSGRQNSKSYRYFELLEAFENNQSIPTAAPTMNPSVGNPNVSPVEISAHATAEDSSTSSMSSSSREGEEEEEASGVHNKKRRKMKEYFERLMKQVLEKQEKMQRQLIETIEKCEKNRVEREEAWKMQEMARLKRERELFVQERSISAAKDAAVLAFLQKFSDQAGSVQFLENPTPIEKTVEKSSNTVEVNTGNVVNESNLVHGASSARWPKEEVEALIRLKTNLDFQHHENGPKGPQWEEVSSAMKKLGYERSAKRCKEKWENINKYFKRVKENRRKRPDNSKTCPYFHQLDALYKERDKKTRSELKPEELLLQMTESTKPNEDIESEDVEENRDADADADDDDDDDDGDDDDGLESTGLCPQPIAMMG